MIFYFASQTYQQVISTAIKESDMVLVGQECKNDLFFLKYVKEKQNVFTTLDFIVLDINACEDTDEELLEALDILKIVNDGMRIIILAANRYAGDFFLTKCFQMGIYDLISTDDFLIVKQELIYSLTIGKKYGDSLQYKEEHPEEKTIIKEEIKQTVNKVMIAVAGASRRIGVTHNCIILANFLRKKGYMVAIVELSGASHFKNIQDFYDERMLDGQYFSMKGVDFYPSADLDKLSSVLGKTYNFIIADFGLYETCDLVTYNKAEVRMLVCGSKPWEIGDVNSIFAKADEETLKGYYFCFSFTSKGYEKEIQEGMSGIDNNNIFFMPYSDNPFKTYDFHGAENILKDYLAIKVPKPKKGFFKKEKKEKKDAKKEEKEDPV